MKAQDRSNYITGAVVILCSAVLLAALTFALAGTPWRTGGKVIYIDFHDATGIKLHSAARYAGKSAGTVSEIRYLTAGERAQAANPGYSVRIAIKLNPDVPPLDESVTASVTAETLLGEKFVALTPGKPGARPLPEGAVIAGTASFSIDAVAASASEAMGKVNALLANFQADYPSLVPRVAEILAQGSSILGQGSNLVNNADTTILNANSAVTRLKEDYNTLIPRLNSLFAQAQTIATNADHAVLKVSLLLDRLDGVVRTNEANLDKTLDELRVASQNLKVITTYAKVLAAALAERPSTLVWGRKKQDLPSEEQILQSAEPVPVSLPAKR